MLDTIIAALLPIVVTLGLGFVAAWRDEFDEQHATVLNRMVMRYALPLALFTGTVTVTRSDLADDAPLAAAIGGAMLGGYAVAYGATRRLLHRDRGEAALIALAVSGPAVPFIGTSVLGYLFGTRSSVAIAIAALVMNLAQVPVCLVLLSLATTATAAAPARSVGAMAVAPVGAAAPPVSLGGHVRKAIAEPVVWAPLTALVLVLVGLTPPESVDHSLELLGRATGGVALFASGVVLYCQRVRLDRDVIAIATAKNVVFPLVLWLVLVAAGLSDQTVREAVLAMGIPSASICVVLAVRFGVAERLMASSLFYGTLSSVVSMATLIWLTGS